MDENLRKWFKEEDWVRIDTQGNIAGSCGSNKKGKKTQRCLPRKKAQSLSKAERKATARKKTASKKQFVKNTKKAKVSLKKESMDKKELKALILKTLEKEGGAAGLKALTKASKISKKDLEPKLSKMGGVKQHQDGDYISTPINEEEFVMAGMGSWSPGNCMCSCPSGMGSAGSGGYGGTGASTFGCSTGGVAELECTKCCAQAPCESNSGEEVSNNTSGPLRFLKDPKRQIKLREASGQIFEMLTEKLCKKGKAYVARRKAAGEKHGAYLMGRAVKVCKGQMSGNKKKNEELYEVYTIENIDEIQMIEDALNGLNEKKGKCKPSKGKRFAKRVDGKCRSFGQAGKAKKGGDRIRPGTAKGHAYCARSAKIKKCKNPPCANALSRKKWKCQGSRSVK